MDGHPGASALDRTPPTGRLTVTHRDNALTSVLPLGHRPLGAVRRSETQGWVKKVTDVLAPTTAEVVYRWVATMFKAAVADRLIPAPPCIRIALPKRDRSEVVPSRWPRSRPWPTPSMLLPVHGRLHRRHGPAPWRGVRGPHRGRVDFLHRQVRVDRQLGR